MYNNENALQCRITIDHLEFTVSSAVILLFLKNLKIYLSSVLTKTLLRFCSIRWIQIKNGFKNKVCREEQANTQTDTLTVDFINADNPGKQNENNFLCRTTKSVF